MFDCTPSSRSQWTGMRKKKCNFCLFGVVLMSCHALVHEIRLIQFDEWFRLQHLYVKSEQICDPSFPRAHLSWYPGRLYFRLLSSIHFQLVASLPDSFCWLQITIVILYLGERVGHTFSINPSICRSPRLLIWLVRTFPMCRTRKSVSEVDLVI